MRLWRDAPTSLSFIGHATRFSSIKRSNSPIFNPYVKNSRHLPLVTLIKMSRATVADFVDSFFTRILFQADDTIAASVLDTDLAPDVEIV